MLARFVCWLVGHAWTYERADFDRYVQTGEGFGELVHCARCGRRT